MLNQVNPLKGMKEGLATGHPLYGIRGKANQSQLLRSCAICIQSLTATFGFRRG